MTTRHYVDESGNYIGGFGDGATAPSGSTLVPSAPTTAADTWNGSVWDTSGQIVEARERAVVSRATFFINVWKAGVLSKADAMLGARGEMPADFTAALIVAVAASQITQAQADEAEILLAAATQVERSNSYIALMQAYYSMTDAQVDALFGIS